MNTYFIQHKDQFDGLSMEDQDVILQMLTNAIQYDQRVCLYGLDNRLYEANLLAIDEALEYYHNGGLKSYLLPLPLYKEFTGQISHVGNNGEER